MKVFLLLLLFEGAFLVNGTCTTSYSFEVVCSHYDEDCLEREGEACEPTRTTFYDAHCPLIVCVSIRH